MATTLPVLQGPEIHWNGEPIAVVVADSQEAAEYAATLIRAEYAPAEAHVSFAEGKRRAELPADALILMKPSEVIIGDAEAALRQAAHRVDNLYTTPRHNHNALEPHATIAAFEEDGRLLVFDSTQNGPGVKSSLAQMFDLKAEQVQVMYPFVGGGFGGKGFMWLNTVLAVLATRQTGRPVKLALSRAGVFRSVGGRTASEQRVAIGADADGRFRALIHAGVTPNTDQDSITEQFTLSARHLYAADNFYCGQQVFNLDTISNTQMRAPGESIGSFALESAVDELAHQLGMDPVALRARNEPARDPSTGHAFSLRNVLEAYRRGAEQFKWQPRPPRSQRDGEWLVGQGVASAEYSVLRQPATAKICLYADGTAVVKAAAHEMGMGTATVQLQHAADRLGLPLENVSFQYGDTNLPTAAMAGGSMQTVSVAAAISAAADELRKQLFDLAKKAELLPLRNFTAGEVELKTGGLYHQQQDAQGRAYTDILRAADQGFLEVEGTSAQPLEIMKYSMQSYGAQFAEVRVNELTGEVRVARWVGAFDVGRILNPKTATSQLRGGIIMGIGMALTEETLFDERSGRITNPSLAEYHVPVHADVPPIDVIFLDIPDEHTPLGAHGLGEIGITGAAAAIANAIFNATGIRIRSLPITLDKLLAGPGA